MAQGDRDGALGNPARIIGRTVYRIYNPGVLPAFFLQILFLAEEASPRNKRAKLLAQKILHGDIG